MATTKRRTVGIFLAILGIAAGAMGLVLPWGRAEGPFVTVNTSAFDLNDGTVVAVLLIVATGALVLHSTREGALSRWSGVTVLVCGVAIAGIAIVDIGDVAGVETIVQTGGGRIDTKVGEGLYLVLAGGALLLVGMTASLLRVRPGPYTSAPDAEDEGEDDGVGAGGTGEGGSRVDP